MYRWLTAVVLLLTVSAGPVLAQGPEQTFNRFRAHTTAGTYVNGWEGRLTATELTGRNANGQSFLIPRSELTRIEYEGGTQSGKGALIGAGSAVLFMGLVALRAAELEADPAWEVDWSKFTRLGVIITGASTAVGALIGAQYPGWKTLHLRDR